MELSHGLLWHSTLQGETNPELRRCCLGDGRKGDGVVGEGGETVVGVPLVLLSLITQLGCPVKARIGRYPIA